MKKEKESKEVIERLKVRNTRKLYIPFYFMVVVLWLAIIYIKFSGKPLDNLALKLVIAFSLAVIIATEIHRLGHSYEISDNSVIHRKGYLTITTKRIEFGAISDIDVKQTLWQRLWRFGNIQIFKFSEKSVIRNINKPLDFVSFLERKLRGRRGRVT